MMSNELSFIVAFMSRKRAAPGATCKFDLPGSSPEPPASPPPQHQDAFSHAFMSVGYANPSTKPISLKPKFNTVNLEGLNDVVTSVDGGGAAAVVAEQARGLPHSHTPIRDSDLPLLIPGSPVSNKDKYMAICSPVKVNCSLSAPGLSNPNTRFDFQAVVLIAYPSCEKPERRHVFLSDRHGATGLTVWANHVAMFIPAAIGKVVKISNLTVSNHNGKRTLAMARDSSIKFLSDEEAVRTDEGKWWNSFNTLSPLTINCACMMDDDAVVNVSGVLFMIFTETKRVRNDEKELLTIRIADHSGQMDIRSWNHKDSDFRTYLDKPISLMRIRITSFATKKIGEMLDGNGTVSSPVFFGSEDLARFWKAPAQEVD